MRGPIQLLETPTLWPGPLPSVFRNTWNDAGKLTPDYIETWLGVKWHPRLWIKRWRRPYIQTDIASAIYPRHTNSEDFRDFVSLLRSIEEAVARGQDIYTMVNLGSQSGRWEATAAVLCKRRGMKARVVSVDCGNRFRWLQSEHMAMNGLIRDIDYEQTRIDKELATMDDVYRCLPKDGVIDLVNCDIEGCETEVLAHAEDYPDWVCRVARLHIGVHDHLRTDISVSANIAWTMHTCGFDCEFAYAAGTKQMTEWGPLDLSVGPVEGVQAWVNPRLAVLGGE